MNVHKGGKNENMELGNCTAISMTSLLLKMYEHLFIERCESNILSVLSTHQGCFHKEFGHHLYPMVAHYSVKNFTVKYYSYAI